MIYGDCLLLLPAKALPASPLVWKPQPRASVASSKYSTSPIRWSAVWTMTSFDPQPSTPSRYLASRLSSNLSASQPHNLTTNFIPNQQSSLETPKHQKAASRFRRPDRNFGINSTYSNKSIADTPRLRRSFLIYACSFLRQSMLSNSQSHELSHQHGGIWRRVTRVDN